MPSHPSALAVKARDLDAMIDTLAPDVVFRSPLISAPVEGREQVGDLFRVLAETFLFGDDTRYTEEIAAGDRVVLFFEAKLKGRQVHGADLLRLDDQGKIREMTVFVR